MSKPQKTPILYDPLQSHNIFTIPSTHPPADSSIPPPPPLKPLHFLPLSANSRLLISHSGLTVTATTSDEEFAVANIGFKEGVHYWEINCPLSCENISLGVIKEGFHSNKPMNQNMTLASLWQFRTSTPRIIGIKMDFNNLEVRCWLNGNFQPQRIIKLTAGASWFPCVKIREKGNQVILNPFGCEPGKQIPYIEIPGIAKLEKKKVILLQAINEKFANWRFFEKKQLNLVELKQCIDNVDIFQDVKLVVSEEFLGVFAEKSLKVLLEKLKEKKPELIEIDRKFLHECFGKVFIGENSQKSPEENQIKFIDFIQNSFLNQAANWLESTVNELNIQGFSLNEKAYKSAVEHINKIHWDSKEETSFEASEASLMNLTRNQDSLVIITGNKIKLIRRNPDKSFEFPPNLFETPARFIEDQISVSAKKDELQFLLIEFPWIELFHDEDSAIVHCGNLFRSLCEAIEAQNNRILFKMPAKEAKIVLDFLLQFLRKNLMKTGNLYCYSEEASVLDSSHKEKLEKQFKEENLALPFAEDLGNPEENKEKDLTKSTSSNKNSSTNTKFAGNPNQLLSNEKAQSLFAILSHMEAQIYLKTLNVQSRLFPYNISRPNLTINRLASFLNFSNNANFQILDLAEAGLFNINDHFQELRHFLDSGKILENIQNIRVPNNNSQDLWRLLQNLLPENRMFQGLLTPNVSLQESLYYLPYLIHGTKQSNPISLKSHKDYLMLFSKDGIISLWNAETLLSKLYESDFRTSFKPEKKPQISEENQVLENEEMLLFDDSLFKAPSQKELIKKEEPSKIPPLPSKDPEVIPDPSMIEALYNMGFPVDLAKKALIKIKNADLSMALDTILVIQEEESKNPNKVASFKSNTTLLKPQWQCHACTFMNINSTNKNCQVCGTQAPIDAFYTEEELNREEEAQKKLKVEQEKIKELIPVEEKKEIIEETKKNPIISEEEIQQKNLKLFRENLLKSGKINGEFLIGSNISKAAGIIAGMAFSNNNNNALEGVKEPFSIIRIRRLAMKYQHLMSFVALTKTDHGFLNSITREWTRDETFLAIEESLFEESSRFSIEVLDPFFNPGENWETLQELDFEVNLAEIDDICWTRKSVNLQENIDEFLILIQGKSNENERKIIIRTLIMNSTDPYGKPSSISIGSEVIKEILLDPKNEWKFYRIEDFLMLISGEKVIFLNFESLEFEKNLEITSKFKINKVQILEKEVIFMGHQEAESFKIPIPSKNLKNEEKSIEDLENKKEISKEKTSEITISNKNEDYNLEPKELSMEELNSLRNLLNVESVGCSSINSHKTHLDPLTGLYTRHHWLFPQKEPFELLLKTPENLVNILLEFHLENKAENYKNLQELLEKEAEFIKNVLKSELSPFYLPQLSQNPIISPIINEIQEKKPQISTVIPTFSMNSEFLNDLPLENSEEIDNKSKVAIIPNNASFPEGNYIPLRVKFYEGAAYNSNIFVSKVLIPNKEIFITNYYNSFFILENLEENLMNIESIIIQSDFGVINGGFPLGAGLIFLSNSISAFFVNTQLHTLTPSQYKDFYNNRGNKEPFEWEPVAAFQFDEKSENLQIELDYKRPSKYVLIKPTNMRTSPKDFSAQFKTSPIEIRFIGAQGNIIENNQGKELLEQYYSNANIDKKARKKLEIAGEIIQKINKGLINIEVLEDNDKWRLLDSEKLELNASEFLTASEEGTRFPYNSQKLKIYCEKGLPLSGKVLLELMEKSIKTSRIKGIRIINKINENEPLDLWKIKGLSIELQVPRNSILKKDTPLCLRSWLIDLDFYVKFNRKLVKMLVSEEIAIESKKTVSILLSDLMEMKGLELIRFIYKDLDLLGYLTQNVLKETLSIAESRKFLGFFIIIPEFQQDLLLTLFKLLNNLTNLEISPLGLKAFLGLFGWCHNLDYEASFFEILGTLQNVAKKVKKLRSPNYNLLRVQYNIASLAFEPQLFSNENCSFSRKKENVKKSNKILNISTRKNLLKSKILIRKTSFGRKFLIDLTNEHNIDAITLIFEKSDQTNVKILVKIWIVDSISGQKTLIQNDFYRESLYIQLTNFAFQEENNKQIFNKAQKLNTLGFSGFSSSISSRFLIIQITHSFFPAFRLANEQTANNQIIPEIYGSPIANINPNKPQIYHKKVLGYQELLSQKIEDLKLINFSPNIQNSLEGNLYEIKDKKELFFYDSTIKTTSIFSEGNLLKDQRIQAFSVDQEQSNSEFLRNYEALQNSLATAQSELATRLFQYRTMNVGQIERTDIQDLCETIEEIQLQLLSLNSQYPNLGFNALNKASGENLDFLYTLVMKLSRFLRKIDNCTINQKNQKSWRSNDWIQNEKGKFIALELFESLVVQDLLEPSIEKNSMVSNEIIRLLTEVLIDNLNDREWQHFVVIILKKFLSQPISIISSPLDKLFSHNRLLQALDQISIPNGEVLAYLAYRLGIQFDNNTGLIEFLRPPLLTNISIEDRKTQESSALCQIVSILILLYKGFNKIPFDTSSDPKKIIHKGSYCFNCGQGKFITGTRLKCLNCATIDSCSNGICENKHLLLYPMHSFIIIEEPLPLVPSKRSQPEPISLAIPFTFVEPLTDIHGINCENCNKEIIGIRMMCANCEDFSVCKQCYELRNHTKFHVFIKLDNKIQVPPNSTPKCLIQFLDPLLYPLKTTITENDNSPMKKKLSKGVSREVSHLVNEDLNNIEPEEIKAIGLKKSVSSPARDYEYLTFLKKSQKNQAASLIGENLALKTVFEDEEIPGIFPRFDYEDSLKITMQVCVWICDCSHYSDCDRIYVLSLCFDLLMEIMKLSSMVGIKDLLANSSSFLKVFLIVLKLASSPLLTKFNVLLETFASPKNAPRTDEAFLNALNSYEKSRNFAEKSALDESRILLVYHLQTVLHWVLDYALNPGLSTLYSQTFKENLSPSIWLEQISFVLELFLTCSEKLTKISKKSTQNQQNMKPPKRQPSTLQITEEINVANPINQNNETMNLSPPGVYRSMSLPMDEPGKKILGFPETPMESSKVQTLSLQTAINLIDLLFPKNQVNSNARNGFNFAGSAKMWSLVFKAVLKVKMSVLAENNVFNSLINAFLLADEEIQHTMFQEILHLTQNMINQGSFQKEFSNSILSILFKFINENMRKDSTNLHSFSSISFNLLKGWLDILLTKVTPKPEEFYTKPFEKAFCRLNNQGALQLLDNISEFLINHVNFGGRDGIQLATETDIMKLNLADDMLKLLIFSESQNNVFAISELFLSAREAQFSEITHAMKRIIDWYLLNQSKDTLTSPSTDLMLSLSNSCLKLFALAGEVENIAKICIRELVSSCKELDDLLVRKFRASQLSNYLSLNMNEQNCRILEELLDLWVTNDSLASFVAFEVKGFEFLLDRIGVTISSPQQIEENSSLISPDSNKSSLLAGTDLLDYIQSSFYNEKNLNIANNNLGPNNQAPAAPNLNKIIENAKKKEEKVLQSQSIKSTDLKEEEFANKIYIINQPGQHWSGIAPDWSLNKKGIRARILFFQMSNQFYSEYSLMLELDRVCEMKQLKIGFNTVWTDYNDKVLGIPSSILLEGGLNKNSLTPLGTLELINDEGYSNYSVKVFKKNFQTLQTNSQQPIMKDFSRLDLWLKSLNNRQVKVIRLTFRRPIVTFVENLSMLSNKTYKNVCVAISFLSITGYDIAKMPGFVFNSLLETQKNSALQVLGKLCNSNYSETLNTLANRVDVITKIKNSFDFLSNLLVMHDNWLAPVFLAIAHNQETGDFIINKFLDIEKSAPHAKMILEIILTNPNKAFPRLLLVFAFIKEKLNLQRKNPSSLQNISAILYFIDTLTAALRLLANELAVISSEKYNIPCVAEDIEALTQAFEVNSANPQITKALVKLLVSLLFVTDPFVLAEKDLVVYALNHVYSLMKKTHKIAFYELFSQLIAGYQKASIWFLTDHRLEELLDTLLLHLDEYEKSPENLKLSKAILQILNGAVSLDDTLKQYVLKKDSHLLIYNKMKQIQGTTILKISDNETLALLVDFIKNVALGYVKSEETLAEALKSDLSLLETRRDMQYVTQFLIPLLNAEINVPICLHLFDSHSKKWLIEGRKPSKVQRIAPITTPEAFQSKAFTPIQRESFENMLKQMTSPSGLYNKILKSSNWELAVTQDSDAKVASGDQVFNKVLKNGPFIMILEGTNSGKNCITGVFSSQSISDNPVEDYSYEKIYNIPTAADNFIFYYDEEFCMHFNIPNYPGQNFLGHYHMFEDGGSGLSFHYNGQERIFVSFQAGTTTYVDINLYDMKAIDENPKNFPGDIPADFQFRKCEFWVLKQPIPSIINNAATINSSKISDNLNIANVLYNPWYNIANPLNLYRSSPVYNVPAAITVEKMSKCFFNNIVIQLKSHNTKERLKPETPIADIWEFIVEDPNSNRILDLDFDVHELLETKPAKDAALKKALDDKTPAYMPNMSIFEAFERCGGVNRIIEVILKSLSLWKNKNRAKNWHAWVNELHSFSNLPHFFGLLMKNKECIELLFQLLKGTPDEEPEKPADKKAIDKKWEDEEQKAVRFSYKILSDVFKVDNNSAIRDFALEKQLLDRFLDRIALIAKENGRKYQEVIPEEKKEEEVKIEKKKEEDDGKKKIVKKKGIGYASDNTGQNQKWNINEYHETKKNQSEQLQSLLAILETFLDFNDWKPPKKFSDLVCTSALLPLIEAAFRSGSLLDMSKDSELFISFLRITRLFSRHHSLIPLLLDLDRHYFPQQTESIFVLLSNLKELASIFKSCMTADTQLTNETAVTEKLANEILYSFDIIEQAISDYQAEETTEANEENQMQDTLNLPLADCYRTLLKDLRFDYTNMKDASGNYKHHYSSYIGKGPYTPPQVKIVRLAQELADLSTALPIEHTNSIFVRCDQTRVDVMKALIMGSAGTPYGHGAFEYDIYFDDNYPSGPPKVNLETTGAGRVRFNPNLYSCGKVCLSLLGTWRGNATENWDPKLSTLLQVLVSLQAIIMSEEVYFNEPGYEGEAGTEEGERKNEAYCNIVRYCNIKFSMIDQLRNPSKGFETVIRRHFYLKKQEIMEECNKWVKYAQVRETSYTGLINDHNSSWCNQFKKSKESYYIMLKEAVKELEDELNKLPVPSVKDVKSKKLINKKPKQKKALVSENPLNSGIMNLEEVDVSYEKGGVLAQKVLDITDEKVKDRWSRYIGAMGIEAVAKQANSSVFLSGMGPLGVEIAKNVVLSGVKRFTIHDDKECSFIDLAGQFFLTEGDIGKNRAIASLEKIQQLNNYVKVDLATKLKKLPNVEEELVKLGLKEYTMIVVCDSDYESQIFLDEFCRKNKIFFISCDCNGPFGRVFLDLGDKFEVLDKNGEEMLDLMVKSITTASPEAKIELLQGSKHNLEDGDLVLITGVEGMELLSDKQHPVPNQNIIKQELLKNSINGSVHKVKVLNKSTFTIGDTGNYGAYVRNGIIKPIKSPVSLEFKSLAKTLEEKELPFDSMLSQHDFMKLENQLALHIAYQILQEFRKASKLDMPIPWDLDSLDLFLKTSEKYIAKHFPVITADNEGEVHKIRRFLGLFALTSAGQFGPLSAFLGGVVSQEIIKAITQKYMPIRQLFYSDCVEIVPELPKEMTDWKDMIKDLQGKEFIWEKNRLDGIKICLGNSLLQKLLNAQIFMVGAGAIGCELLKNYAMLSLGAGKTGTITLTDPDVIETSNLNRQFLFREKHLRKPKSSTAAASALQMNPLLKGHLNARLDKVHEGTANIFTDKFFEDLTIVTNALDNVQARRYIDMRCVNSKTPLIESGTLGPKGHVQVVIPYKTESYSSQEDPQEENEIPHCTLKMFPEETLHCVEWARDKFGKLFFQRPKNLLKILEDLNTYIPTNSQELKNLREAVTFLKKRPLNFEDCVIYARKKFQKYFVNDIRQLIHTYPLDHKTKEGNPFWTLPKRPPMELLFEEKDSLFSGFIGAFACLRAVIFNIPIPKESRTEIVKKGLAERANKVVVSDFKPNEEKSKAILTQVEEKPKTGTEEVKEEAAPVLLDDYKKYVADIGQMMKDFDKKNLKAEEFEKDNDENYHIDFIYALSNCRARNYKLDPMDWVTVKIKAGRIIPALATTTAAIAGLQTIELVKLLKNCKLEDMKNAFLNLAVPSLQLSEPGPPPVIKLTEDLKVNLWDRWDVKGDKDITLRKLFEELKKKYGLWPKDVMNGSQAVYFAAIYNVPGKEKEKEEALDRKLVESLGIEDEKYLNLTVTFAKEEKGEILKGTPPVRIYFD